MTTTIDEHNRRATVGRVGQAISLGAIVGSGGVLLAVVLAFVVSVLALPGDPTAADLATPPPLMVMLLRPALTIGVLAGLITCVVALYVHRSPNDGPVDRRKLLSVATAITLVALASMGWAVATSAHQRPEAHWSTPGSELPRLPSPTTQEAVHASDGGHERSCGSVLVIDQLTRDALDGGPDTAQPSRPADGHQLIAYGDALNNIEHNMLPSTMRAAVTSHSYALVNLGAMINHHASTDEISSMETVVHATGAVLHEFCRE
ncbi:hypothetical protein ACT17_11560 [Mycolicibacterium conceptionense]|jgi:hypothetical protein|uniref:Uncharacterized protein n=1 Tax=Mycolicibacterium conceptionense TaxID=451644 RepID=A0A0J8UD50_9MYCO|nr:hypothetical protein [Mycolicibacterium conceptionense]KMV18270.1 hypothetical protein ACT17_11560 [Mycolicibacterium conceptionense]